MMRSKLLHRAETLLEDSRGIFLYWGKLSGESKFDKDLSEQVVQILLFTFPLTYGLPF